MKRIISAGLAASLVLTLTGCNHTTAYPLLSWTSDREIKQYESSKAENATVNLYYDNTYGMQGYVQDKNNSTTTVNGGTAVNGTLVRLVHALQETVDAQDGSYYTLQKNSNNEFVWQTFTKDLADTFGGKEFYTHKGSLPKKDVSDDVERGPLTQLYEDGKLDYSAVNLVVTDLAEQNVKNYALANDINNKILSQEGYAVALVAFKCDFNGSVRVPDINQVSGIVKGEYHGKRPLYLILTGPDQQLSKIYKNFLAALDQEGLSENQDYYAAYQAANSSTSIVRNTQIVIPPVVQETTKNSFKNYYDSSSFNGLVGLSLGDDKTAKELFSENAESIIDSDLNIFTVSSKKDNGRIVLNYYVPLKEKESYGEKYILRPALRLKDEESTADINLLLEQKDYMLYSWLTSETVTETEAGSASPASSDVSEEGEELPAEEAAASSAETKSKTKTKTKTKKTKTKTKTKSKRVYTWANGTYSDFEDSFTISWDYIDFEADESHILEGAFTDYPKELSAEDNIDLGGCNHWLRINVEATGQELPPAVAFDIPLYAFIDAEGESIPQWVIDWNAKGDSLGSDSYFDHTFNLTGFYSILFAAYSKDESELEQAAREVKIADIMTMISGF